jgi:outer membrane protein assembly factor BamB
MSGAKQAWKKRVDGSFLGSFLDVVSERIVCKVRRERSPALWCLEVNGRTAWDREFQDDDVGAFFPYRQSIYVEGIAARRLSIETGMTICERRFSERVQIRPPISAGLVYVLGDLGESKALMGLHADTLETLWEWPDARYDAHEAQLCRHDAGVMRLVDLKTLEERQVKCARPIGLHGHCGNLLCQFETRERFAVDLANGEIAWSHEEAAEGFHGLRVGDAVFAGNFAYCGGRAMSAFDLKTGDLLWRRDLPGNPGGLRVEAGRVFAGTKAGVIYMLDAATGEVLVTHDLKVEPTAIAPLGPNRIVVGTYKVIYCLEVS